MDSNYIIACAAFIFLSFLLLIARLRRKRMQPEDTAKFRRNLMKQANFYRPDANALKSANVKLTPVLDSIKKSGYRLQINRVHFLLAEKFGFCWGVERSIAIAELAHRNFPQKKIFLTNELIHNPDVNAKLKSMGVIFLDRKSKGSAYLSSVKSGDVVILPAFGAQFCDVKELDAIGAIIVDSTCPWVTKVWNVVEKHKRAGFTSVIHGTANHEETEATKSMAWKFLIVKNLAEAEAVARFIEFGGDAAAFNLKFLEKSKGFDPVADLVRIGVANQTTMLKSETEEVSRVLKAAVEKKPGGSFMSLNTICDATQERQDAMLKMCHDNAHIDVMLIIGGFNSSNTMHLLEIANDAKSVKCAFHIDSARRIDIANNLIEHKILHGQIVLESFLPLGVDITVGITSGASTPDEVVEDCLNRILSISA